MQATPEMVLVDWWWLKKGLKVLKKYFGYALTYVQFQDHRPRYWY